MDRAFLNSLKDRLSLSEAARPFLRLERRGRDFWACCPFHHEKTPSFKINDEKGRYYCFGCKEQGDVFELLTTLKKISFAEAVEELAASVGMPMPKKQSAAVGAQRAQSKSLHALLAKTKQWFMEMLRSSEGGEARDYLLGRGIRPDAWAAFSLGWAPDAVKVQRYFDTCMREGYTASDFEEAGLATRESGDGRGGYLKARFKSRIMFPIHNYRGQVVGFGGRSLDGRRAKYLNSPETAMFKKREHVYGLWEGLQTKALQKKPIMVVEGYLDVMALQMTGVSHGVAALGTSLSPIQLEKIWRLGREPYLCFDGDDAGKQAAHRVMVEALPLLKPGYTLRFVQLPEGEDPHSLLSQGQAPVFFQAVDRALSILEYMWGVAEEQCGLKTPDQQASFKALYRGWGKQMVHPDLKSLYMRNFDARFNNIVFETQRYRGQKNLARPLRHPNTARLQEKLLVLTLLMFPKIIEDFYDSLTRLSLSGSLDNLLHGVLEWFENQKEGLQGAPQERAELHAFLEETKLYAEARILLQDVKLRSHLGSLVSKPQSAAIKSFFQDILSCFQRSTTLRRDIALAEDMFARHMHEGTWSRLQKVRELYLSSSTES